jgi:hypothetical protein
VYWSAVALSLFILAVVTGLTVTVLGNAPPLADQPGGLARMVNTDPVALGETVARPTTPIKPLAWPQAANGQPPVLAKLELATPLVPKAVEAPREAEAASLCESENYGTSVAFLANPAEAGRQASRDSKLLFVLHISGNFEDRQFT